MQADVIVVGLGAMGSAAAWQLARRGARVLGIDRYAPPHDQGSSHGLTRVTREAVGEGEAYAPLVRRSHAIWRELEAELGPDQDGPLMARTGVLVMDGDRLAGIITQGDCAIKVLLPGRDAKQTLVSEVMTANPMTVKPADPLEACMGLMANRGFRHLPVMDDGRVVGVVSVGDVVKDSIRRMGEQIGFLETYIKGHGA